MPVNPNPTDQLLQSIHDAIQKHIDSAKEQVIKDAVAEFEKSVRESVGKVSISLAEYFSIQRVGQDIIIHATIKKQ